MANVQFGVVTFGRDEFPMVASPMTRISGIRKMLQDVDTEELPWDELRLTIDGLGNIRETQTLWDLDILSGTTFSLSVSLSPHFIRQFTVLKAYNSITAQ